LGGGGRALEAGMSGKVFLHDVRRSIQFSSLRIKILARRA